MNSNSYYFLMDLNTNMTKIPYSKEKGKISEAT
jgi:hypothetical protein